MRHRSHMHAAASPQSVLFVLNSLDIGGSERKTVRLANALAAQDWRVAVAYLSAPDTLRAELTANVDVIPLGRTGKFSLHALRALYRAIRRTGARTVVSVNMYPTLYAALLARLFPAMSRVRFIASMNTTVVGPRTQRQMLLYRPLLGCMDRLVFGAEYQRAIWMREHLSAGSPATCVLYNGVDTHYFSRHAVHAQRVAHWPAARVVIGSVGRLSREKSQDQLLHAAHELVRRGCDVGVVLVGQGGEQQALAHLAQELDIAERVHFAGAHRDVRPWLAGFDIFALTSVVSETFSNAALEALSMGCPVVSSRVGGMPEMLGAGGGLTYDPENIAALVDALESLIVSKARRDALGEAARRSVIGKFSMEAMLSAFRDIVAEAVAEQAVGGRVMQASECDGD